MRQLEDDLGVGKSTGGAEGGSGGGKTVLKSLQAANSKAKKRICALQDELADKEAELVELRKQLSSA